MPRETIQISYYFTIFALLTVLQSSIVTPIFYSRKLVLQPDEFFLTYTPSEGSIIQTKFANWFDPLENIDNDRMRYLPFQRLSRNTGPDDEARYQIRHVGDLPMFRFG